MIVLRPRVLLSLLATAVLLSLVVPTVDAGVPRAHTYHVGGAITLDTDLVSASGVSAWAIDEYLASTTPLPKLGAAFLAAERKYGVNARFLLAAALHESGWGTSYIARVKHNLFGFNAYDRDPARYASAYDTYAANVAAVAKFMKASYLTPGGRFWCGQPTLRCMQRVWSSSGRWGISVSRLASSIRLDSISGRSITFAAPILKDTLHGGARTTVQLKWSGGDIPAAVEFTATWEPIELDADTLAAKTSGYAPEAAGIDAATPDAAASPEPPSAAPAMASTVAAGRARTADRAITLTTTAPAEPGTYLLAFEMRDAGGKALPAAQQVDIPSVEARVWGDRAVSIALEPTADGTGARVQVTNTGRQTIPAVSAPDPADATSPDVTLERTTITVTAAFPTATLLKSWPLVQDLAPGATVTVEVPAIEAATGRSENWLDVGVSVLGDPAWLGVTSPVGCWFASAVPTSGTSAWATADTGGSTPAATPTPTPSPVATPTPTQAPSATPTPTPAAVTRTYSERSSLVAYRGAWGSAQGAYGGGSVAWSTSAGATATLTFTGSKVAWLGPMGPTRGTAIVLLDGKVVARVSTWRSSFVARAVLYKHTFATSGRHTLTIKVVGTAGHPMVAIDGFSVRS